MPLALATCMSQFKMADSGNPAKTEAADLLSKQVFANITAIDFLVGAIEGLWHVFVGPQTLHSGLDSTLHYVISFFFPTCVVIWGLVWLN